MSERTLDADIAQLRKDLEAIRGDIGALSDSLRSATGAAANSARKQVAEGAARVGETVRESAHAAQAATERSIADHPMASVAMAFGIGMVIGRLLDRR